MFASIMECLAGDFALSVYSCNRYWEEAVTSYLGHLVISGSIPRRDTMESAGNIVSAP